MQPNETTMKTKELILIIATIVTLLTSCGGKSPIQMGASGKPYEILVVMDKTQWEKPAGRALYETLTMQVPGLPQIEPAYDISYTPPGTFDSMLKMVRNIVIADISDIYTAPKISYTSNQWANNQAVLKIQAPDEETFQKYTLENASKIIRFFNDIELDRTLKNLSEKYNGEAARKIKEQFGVELHIPNELNKYKQGEQFFWASNDAGAGRRDIVVYTFPYTDQNTFTRDYLVAKRDSVMKINIPGTFEGSYMTTEKRIEPQYTPISVMNTYCGELRGLWRMQNDMMGGPFVSHARLDETNQKIIVVEAFVYAPEKRKRNLINLTEAVLYTLKLPGEFDTPETIQLPITEEK